MSRPTTVTILRSIEVEVEIEVEVSGRYVPAKTYGPPERCSPAEYPDAEVLSAQTEDGIDVLRLLSRNDIEAACERAIEQIAGDEADAYDAAAEDDADARREMARERD